MKKTLLLFSFTLFFLTLSAETTADIQSQLQTISRVANVKTLSNSVGYASKFVLSFSQPLDHLHPEKGTFSQRIIVMHRATNRPTVIVTEGYSANYALNPNYLEELSSLFNTNVIFVEHRFFAKSTPSPCNWQYMTERNAMGDLHDIVTAFKTIYHNKWISTGISKGGQTCMEFRAFYPQDVDISVPYVGPLCFAVEDGRHEPFLRQNGSELDRKRIQDFQTEILVRKQHLLPAFETYCLKKNLHFNIPMRDVFDFCVLEYSFAHWQWGTPTSGIPATTAADSTFLKELLAISGPDYFAPNKDFTPFFYQAAYELGYYGYDMKPFKKLMSIKTTRNYLHRVMLPDSLNAVKYHPQLSRSVRKFLLQNDPKMIFIYGQIDPWTAAGVTWLKGKQNMHVFIQPGGSHLSRIKNMPPTLRDEILQILSDWIGEKPQQLQKAA